MASLNAIVRSLGMARAGIVRVAAPLATARGGDSMYWEDPDGQRRYQRIQMHREIAELYVDEGGTRTTVSVRMLDLSIGGARISGAGLTALSASATVRMTMPLPDRTVLLGVPARIVWKQQALGGTVAGLEFKGLTSADQRRIQAAMVAANYP